MIVERLASDFSFGYDFTSTFVQHPEVHPLCNLFTDDTPKLSPRQRQACHISLLAPTRLIPCLKLSGRAATLLTSSVSPGPWCRHLTCHRACARSHATVNVAVTDPNSTGTLPTRHPPPSYVAVQHHRTPTPCPTGTSLVCLTVWITWLLGTVRSCSPRTLSGRWREGEGQESQPLLAALGDHEAVAMGSACQVQRLYLHCDRGCEARVDHNALVASHQLLT